MTTNDGNAGWCYSRHHGHHVHEASRDRTADRRFGATCTTFAVHYYDRTVDREAAAIVVKIGDEYLAQPLRR
jgi:hypothetical protein